MSSSIPVDLQRKFERRWAARFISPVTSATPKSTDLKGAVSSSQYPAKAKEKPAGLSQRARSALSV
jgi:hypothetical protein